MAQQDQLQAAMQNMPQQLFQRQIEEQASKKRKLEQEEGGQAGSSGAIPQTPPGGLPPPLPQQQAAMMPPPSARKRTEEDTWVLPRRGVQHALRAAGLDKDFTLEVSRDVVLLPCSSQDQFCRLAAWLGLWMRHSFPREGLTN